MLTSMIDRTSNSTLFSDATIRRFLLGQLNASDQTVFEQNLFTNEQLEWRVRFAEVALADDYACGRLTSSQNQLLREKFLVTADRKRMVGVSQALRDRCAAHSQRASTAQSLRAIFDFGQPAWRYAFAALLLLLVFATVWRGIKEPNIVKRIVPERVASPKPTVTPVPQEANHPGTNSSPSHAQDYPEMPVHTPTALTIPLDFKSTAENPALVVLPKGEGAFVRFELQIPNDQVPPFRAELWTSRGESILAVDSVAPASDAKIVLVVPAEKLQAGDYQIRLSNQSGAVVSSYFLRLR